MKHNILLSMQWVTDHPRFSSNPFYIGGGSYSGFTTAPLVQKVYDGKHKLGLNAILIIL